MHWPARNLQILILLNFFAKPSDLATWVIKTFKLSENRFLFVHIFYQINAFQNKCIDHYKIYKNYIFSNFLQNRQIYRPQPFCNKFSKERFLFKEFLRQINLFRNKCIDQYEICKSVRFSNLLYRNFFVVNSPMIVFYLKIFFVRLTVFEINALTNTKFTKIIFFLIFYKSVRSRDLSHRAFL